MELALNIANTRYKQGNILNTAGALIFITSSIITLVENNSTFPVVL
jgi:hypothetical protein